MNLAEWVQYQRLRCGWNKADLVRESNVSRQILHEVENGSRTYERGSPILSRIENALGVEYDPDWSPKAGSELSGWVVENPKLLGRVVAALIRLDEDTVREIASSAESESDASHSDDTPEDHPASDGRRNRRRGRA